LRRTRRHRKVLATSFLLSDKRGKFSLALLWNFLCDDTLQDTHNTTQQCRDKAMRQPPPSIKWAHHY
jgi:hypothetical protein